MMMMMKLVKTAKRKQSLKPMMILQSQMKQMDQQRISQRSQSPTMATTGATTTTPSVTTSREPSRTDSLVSTPRLITILTDSLTNLKMLKSNP